MPDNFDERAKIEIQLATLFEIALIAVDGGTLKYIKKRIAELEQRLRHTDEQGRLR
jgi:hypothetical protein